MGATATVTDFNTGTTFTIKRTGGTNHAEVETATAADTKNFLKTFDKDSGKSFTWEKRAVVVTVGGTDYAASLFGWPHGDDSVAGNNMEGQTCLYFAGSTSDVLGLPDQEHTDMVEKATAK